MASETDYQSTSLTSLLSTIFSQAASPTSPPPPPSGPSTSTASSSEDPALRLLSLIERCNNLANSLSLFSENDTLEDLPTGTLRALFIQSVWAEVESNVMTAGNLQARKARLQSSRSHYITFVRTLFDLSILPKAGGSAPRGDSPLQLLASLLRPLSVTQASSSSMSTSLPTNPHQRRELKVSLFKLERALKNALDEYRHAVRAKAGSRQGGGLTVPSVGTSTAHSSHTLLEEPEEAQWDLLVLPRPKGRGEADEDEDEGDESTTSAFVSGTGRSVSLSSQQQQNGGGVFDSSITTPTHLRGYLLMLLHLHALLAYNNLAAMDDEIQLLSNIPASAIRDARESQAREEAELERRRGGGSAGNEFRLDRRFDAATPGPLMDDKGKPLRPFTITSSSGKHQGLGETLGGLPVHDLDERQRIRDGVFRPGHRLPTMSIDEYLAEEERRGNIIKGGGAAGAAQPTPRESRALRAENDGTREAQDAEEEARREAIEWDEFKETNKRGAGNTMNRG